ncbi:MAG: hypothetical protein ABIC40_08805, partial [bacterium]
MADSAKEIQNKPEIENTPISFPDRFWLFFLVIFVFISRYFFLDMGFGNPDSWRVAVTGKLWITTGEYFPSRPPGFPLVEMLSALSYFIFRGSPGTWILTNLLTCLVFCASVVGVWHLARKWNAENPLLIATVYSFAPLNWIYSIETIDYLWMTSFLIFAFLIIESDSKYCAIWAGIFLGLATSCRFFAALQIIPLVWLLALKRKSLREIGALIISFLAVTLIFYSVVFLRVRDWTEYIAWARQLNKVTSGLAEIEGGTFIRRFLIPASDVYGPLASIAILVSFLIGFPSLMRKIRDRDRGLIISVTVAFLIMAPYVWHLHPYYWIPATAFVLIILARTINYKLFAIVGALIIAANFPWWQTNVEQLNI